MNKRFALLLVMLFAQTASAQDKPPLFSTHFPIRTEAAAPYYRVSVPLSAYLASAHGDLRDLRVFNAAGQMVPHARLAATGSVEEQVQKQALKWFPLHAREAAQPAGDSEDNTLKLTLRQGPDGTLVQIDSRSGSSGRQAAEQAGTRLRGYVLDASKITERRAVRALDLDWDKAGGDFQLLDVESSDDLQHWQRLASGVQLARMEYQGGRIENRRIELNGFRDRYLRLIWREPAAAPKLLGAELALASSRYLAAPLVWSAALEPDADKAGLKPGEYHYRLPHPLPISKLRITLPPGNQLLPVEVLNPGRERKYWNTLAATVVYRISSQGREWSNSDIPLSGYALQDFYLRIDPRLGTPPAAPELRFALQPAQLVFLASGEGPFTLAVGNKDAKDAALPASTLVPGFGQPGSPEIVPASIADDATKNGAQSASSGSSPATQQVPADPRDWKKIALWGVLVLGVLAMAGMAWSLVRQMNQKAD